MHRLVIFMVLLLLFSGCNSNDASFSNDGIENPVSPSMTIDDIRLPSADGVFVGGDDLISVDYSNTSEGYIMVKTNTSDHRRLKVQLLKDDMTYNYDINVDDDYEVFPLNMGSGIYTIRWLENIEDTRYALIGTFDFDVDLVDVNIVYLYPSQYVDYDADTKAVKKSFELTQEDKTKLDRVYHIYQYVIDNIDYDWDKVDEVQGKFVLPIVDETFEKEKGICFDYAALMATMLRVQDIPTKLVTGMVEEGYHAWVEVYIDNIGWIAPHIYFNSDEWTRIDATFDAMDKAYDGYYDTKYEY